MPTASALQTTGGSTTQTPNIHSAVPSDATGEELIVQWRSAVDACKKQPHGFSDYELKAIESFQGPEQLINDLQNRQKQYVALDAEQIFSRINPFFRVLQELVEVLKDVVPHELESLKLVDGGAYVVLKNAVNSTWALNKIVDVLQEMTTKLKNLETYTSNRKQLEIWREGLGKIFISMLNIWKKSVRFLTRYAEDYKIKPNWPDLNVAYEEALKVIRDVIKHVKDMSEAAAAASNETMADLVSVLGDGSLTDYEEEAGSSFPVFDIPELEEPVFLGRDHDMTQLDRYLNPHSTSEEPTAAAAMSGSKRVQRGTVVELKKAVISGMGGIGKSTIAAEYARRSRRKRTYQAMFWIQAETRTTMRSSFTTIAKYLELPKRSDDDENNKMLVMKWLFKTKKTWLLIFDNVEHIEVLSDFLPHGCGSIIITTRSRDLAQDIKDSRVFELAKLTDEQSLAAFNDFRCKFDKLANADAEKEDTERLIRQLDGLALGIKQVAIFIGRSQWTIRKYWQKYDLMVEGIFKQQKQRTDQAPHTLDTAWNVEFKVILTDHPDASKLLSVLCLLSPDNVPYELFIADEDEEDDEDAIDPEYDVCESENRVLEAMLHLHSIALVTKDRERISIHRLVQSAFRYSEFGLSEQQKLQAAVDAAALLLNLRFPNHEGNKVLYGMWNICSLYLSSILSLRTAFESAGSKKRNPLSSSRAFDNLLKNCCWYLYEAGQLYECLDLLDFASRIALDKGSLTYATLCQAYACTYFELNDLPQCRKWNELCLKIRQLKLEPEDPDIANVHANMGNLLNAEGRADDAIAELFMACELLHEEVPDDRVYIAMRLMMTGRAHFTKAFYEDAALVGTAYEQAEKSYREADKMFLLCGPSGAFLHSFLSMDRGNLHMARGNFEGARDEYQNAHDKMAAVNPTSVMVGITQYKLATAKVKLATSLNHIEVRQNLRVALSSARYHKMEGQEARVCRAQAMLFASDDAASAEEKDQSITLQQKAEELKEKVAKVNASVLTQKPRNEDEEYDRLVCLYYR